MTEKVKEETAAAFDEDELKRLEREALGEIKSDSAAVGDVSEMENYNAPDEEMRGLVGGLLGMGFAVLAPNWQIRPEEVEQLTEAYSVLLCKYCPDGLGEYGVELSAVMITFAVFAPRIGTPRVKEEKPVNNDELNNSGMPDILSDEAI